MKKQKIAVAMGGISSEHDVSLKSGAGMLAELDGSRFIGFPLLIGLDNTWSWPKEIPGETLAISAEMAADYLRQTPSHWHKQSFGHFSHLPICDMVLLGLHGVGGEDGRLQGFFELAGIPFSGSGSFGATLAMDKIISKRLYQAHQIPTALYRVLPQSALVQARSGESRLLEKVLAEAEAALGYPMLIKYPKGGSSLGMGIAKNGEEARQLIPTLAHDSDDLLLEAFISGREITCGYLDGHGALAPTEIRPKQDGFFNYAAKYQKGRTEEITPAPMPEATLRRIRELAEQCHGALHLSVYSRTDMMVTDDAIYVLETNTLPGMTPTSVLPQQAHHAGLSYRDLLTRIIEASSARLGAPSGFH